MDFNNNEINILKNIIDARRDVRGNRFLDKKIKKSVIYSILESDKT